MPRKPARVSAQRISRSGAGLEFTKIGASRYDFSDPYHLALTVGWPAFVLAVLGLYVLITAAFAALYLAQPGCVSSAAPGNLGDAFFFSIETLATVGYGEMAPANLYGHLVSSAEIVTGMAFTAIMTGLIFVRFSKAKAKIIYSEMVVVARHNGRPTLMFRIGNARASVMTQLHIQANALVRETTAEGGRFRRLRELPLSRNSIPIFPMVLTLMHDIDEQSPFHGMDDRDLADSEIRVILSLEARDPELSAMVYDTHTYVASDIRLGMRFADAVSQDETGHTVADLTRISEIEPDDAATAG